MDIAALRHRVKHDLLFTEAPKFGGYIKATDVKHEKLRHVWIVFQANVESIRSMAALPRAVVVVRGRRARVGAERELNILSTDQNRRPVLAESNRNIMPRGFVEAGLDRAGIANGRGIVGQSAPQAQRVSAR